MKRWLRKTLLLPVLIVSMMATVLPAQAGDSPYSTADEASGGAATSGPAQIPYSAGGGRKVR